MTATTSQIAAAALAVARHIHDGGYDDVIVSGGSHEVSRALLALGWNALYPGVRMPREFVLDSEANALLYKRHATAGYPHEFEAWMQRSMPDLELQKEKRICFVDDYAFGGDKFRGVSFAFRLLGFTSVDFAFFAAREDTELGRTAFVGERSLEAVAYLRELGQHIQGKGIDLELLEDLSAEARRLRSEALGELRDVGKELKGLR